MGTFLFPFGEGEEGTQTVLLERDSGDQWAETVEHPRVWLQQLTRAPPSGSLSWGPDGLTWCGPLLNSSATGYVDCIQTFSKDLGGH